MNEQEKYDWMVYVSCMTFNHAPYIVDAMNGFTMQETNFPFVCGIVDDASTDSEQEVIKQYLNDHFDLEDKKVARHEETDDYVLTFARHKTNMNCYFAVFYLKYNHYNKKTKAPYLAQWREKAKYIATCEGDDYWIEPRKLLKQVDFLENNPDYGMVCAASKIYVQGVGMKKGYYGHEYRGLEDLLIGNYFYNATVLKRTLLEDRYGQEIGQQPGWKMGDWPRYLHCAIVSKIGYIDEPMSVYRVLPNSASHFDSFDKFKDFNENSVAVSKYFIEKYQLDASDLFPKLDNWLRKRLLLKACEVGNVDLIKQYKHDVEGLSLKEKITVFLSSHYLTNILYGWYLIIRKDIYFICH